MNFLSSISFRLSRVSSKSKCERPIIDLRPTKRPRSIIVSTGTVKWFDGGKGYGFIVADDGGADMFVHHSEIKTEGYAGLNEGQKVDYTVGQGKKGPCATNVIPQQIIVN
jgi:CspA family cold shock protein